MPRIMGVTKVRHDFTAVVNEADEHGQPIYLTNFNELQDQGRGVSHRLRGG